MAEDAPAAPAKAWSPGAIAFLMFSFGAIVLGSASAGSWFLFGPSPDQGPGFGYWTLAIVVLLGLGWKVRWLQKTGSLGPPPTP